MRHDPVCEVRLGEAVRLNRLHLVETDIHRRRFHFASRWIRVITGCWRKARSFSAPGYSFADHNAGEEAVLEILHAKREVVRRGRIKIFELRSGARYGLAAIPILHGYNAHR